MIEELVGQQVSFVDDEEDIASLAGQITDGRVELGEKTAEAERGLRLQANQDLAVEGRRG